MPRSFKDDDRCGQLVWVVWFQLGGLGALRQHTAVAGKWSLSAHW